MIIVRINDDESGVLDLNENEEDKVFYCPFSGLELFDQNNLPKNYRSSENMHAYLMGKYVDDPIFLSKEFQKYLKEFEKLDLEDGYQNKYEDVYYNSGQQLGFYLFLKEKLEKDNSYLAFEVIINDVVMPSSFVSLAFIYKIC